jgi:glycosyltransferase involved in cell wall biosynthesis
VTETGRRIADSTFVIVANGFADGPAQALREYLVRSDARRVVTVEHPLGLDDEPHHVVRDERRGQQVRERTFRLPSRPPLTYPLDLLVPPTLPTADAWFGFNALACARGLFLRRLGRARRVVYWCVDFVDDRFGAGPLTRAYVALDRACCVRADRRFELSEQALVARNDRHGGVPLARAEVVPMGAWIDRVPVAGAGQFGAPVAFLGHLVPRQGVETLLRSLAAAKAGGRVIPAEVIGKGPLEAALRELAVELGLGSSVRFHGFVRDHRDVERILATCSAGVAPYANDPTSFTRYADPGKLKAYVAAGLPVVLTDVAPNAGELAAAGVAVLVEDDPAALANALETLLDDPDEWGRRRRAALELRVRYDWNAILERAVRGLGFV